MAGMQAAPEAQAAAEKPEPTESPAANGDADDSSVPRDPHPLQNRWALWHDKPSKSKGWGSMLKEIATFDTVEGFWSLFNNLLEPSRLEMGHTYSLFKHGIRPEWEDKQLRAGGEWRVQIPPSQKEYLDQYWVETVLTLIREGFEAEESDDIAGVVVNIRKGANRIAIWTISSEHEGLQRNIGTRWREAAIQTQNQMEYFTFRSLKAGGSRRKSTYTV